MHRNRSLCCCHQNRRTRKSNLHGLLQCVGLLEKEVSHSEELWSTVLLLKEGAAPIRIEAQRQSDLGTLTEAELIEIVHSVEPIVATENEHRVAIDCTDKQRSLARNIAIVLVHLNVEPRANNSTVL